MRNLSIFFRNLDITMRESPDSKQSFWDCLYEWYWGSEDDKEDELKAMYQVLYAKEEAKAIKLEHARDLLDRYIRCVKGEEMDYTGRGLWNIFCHALEDATGCKVISNGQ